MLLRIASVLLLGTAVASAQYGTAPSGYYPRYYFGSMFTGDVVEAGDTLTLRYTKGNKTDTLVGRFEKPCDVPKKDGSLGAMEPADVPLGSNLTALYYGRSKVIGGKKTDENVIIGIAFNSVDGNPVAKEK